MKLQNVIENTMGTENRAILGVYFKKLAKR
jgi:hypothetical protein